MAVKHVDVREAHRLVGAEAYTYVDVRSIPEYEQGHPAGAQNITFDASEISSGVYYYQRVSGEFTSIKKLILMK